MFLRNAWYAASWSKDLASQPIGRVFLGESLVLFRDDAGRAAALEDRCCHRAAPLSLGEVKDGRLQCGYHGLQFDGAGACVHIPGQDRIPATARVRAYPVAERWNVVWIWMGDPARADTSLIVDLPWLDDPAWAITPGQIQVACNYQLIIDNLLDVTHVAYLHRNTLAADPREATEPTQTERGDGTVKVGRWLLDVKPPPLFAAAGGFTGMVDRWQHVTYHPPGVVYLDVGCAVAGSGAPQGDRSEGVSFWSNHLLTPCSDTASQYLFSFARNFGINDTALSKRLYEATRATFEEDVVMLEAQQTMLHGGRLDRTVDLIADAAQLHARRLVQDRILAEAA